MEPPDPSDGGGLLDLFFSLFYCLVNKPRERRKKTACVMRWCGSNIVSRSHFYAVKPSHVCMYCYVACADHVVLYVLLLLLLPYYPLHLNMQQSSMGLDLFLILDCYILERMEYYLGARKNNEASVGRLQYEQTCTRRVAGCYQLATAAITILHFRIFPLMIEFGSKISRYWSLSLYIYIHIHAQDSRQNPQHLVRANHESISKYMTSTLLYHASQLQLAREHREKDTVSYQSS